MKRVCAIVLVLGWPALAAAYCRKATQDGIATHRCSPAQPDDAGTLLFWPAGPSYALATGGPSSLPAAVRAVVVDLAFRTWASADCGGAPPALSVRRAAGGVIAFTDEPAAAGTFAETTLRFDRAGAIHHADLRFAWPALAADHAGPELYAVALHEAGHFLGIAHSADPSAVMAGEVDAVSLQRLALAPDDIAAVCAAYPPAPAAPRWPLLAGLVALALATWSASPRRSRARTACPGCTSAARWCRCRDPERSRDPST